MDRKNFTDLIEAMQAINPDSRENIELFARVFFETITEGLIENKFVKIKGVGTFKVIDVSPRDSVDVNTGNRIKIEKHSKITFTPDAYLRDMVNKPFAHLQSLVINEGTDIEQMTISEDEAIEEIHKENRNKENDTSLSIMTDNAENDTDAAEGKEDNVRETTLEVKENNDVVITEKDDNNEATEETNNTSKHISKKLFALFISATAVVFFITGYYIGGKNNVFDTKQNDISLRDKEVKQVSNVSKKQANTVSPKRKYANDTIRKKKENFPIMPIVAGDKYIIIGEQEPHILKQGENITRIAKQIYGSRELAKYIIRFNNISNPDIVPVGTKLKIPKLVPNYIDLTK